jgi:hypothetical protein
MTPTILNGGQDGKNKGKGFRCQVSGVREEKNQPLNTETLVI